MLKIIKVSHPAVLFFALIINYTVFAQNKSNIGNSVEHPKLVVGIVVDQMKYEYLFRYYSKFGNEGFKRLLNEGFFCGNTHFNYVPTNTAPGHACIYTGATPSVNGIIGNEWYGKMTKDTIYCTGDPNVETVGSNSDAGKMSPQNLISTTITDELKYSNNFKSKVIAISMKDRGAILPGGRSADAAYWYDGATGNWITSTYYMKELPAWVNDFNTQKLSDKYLSQKWNTLLPIDQYTESTEDNNEYEETFKGEMSPVFPHDLPSLRGNNFDLLRKTPFGNSLTKDLAMAAIKSENLGKSNYTDFLAVSFSSTDYIGHQFGTNAIETEDCYLRLDKDIEDFLKFIDATFGKNNVLVFLTADHGASPNVTYLSEHKIAAGTFTTKTLGDLVNYRLKNEYGFDSMVSCIMNDQVYLNHDLIKEKKMKLKEVSNSVAKILNGINGISEVVTAQQLSDHLFTEGTISKIQRGYSQSRSGDVMYVLDPGLVEHKSKGTTHGSGYNYDTHVPLIWYGWKIAHGSSFNPVNTVDIAATLAALLHIEFPNGCSGTPIPEVVK
ncbi:MAG: alkaline phosphatase PafA [Bacteroidia bacterium]